MSSPGPKETYWFLLPRELWPSSYEFPKYMVLKTGDIVRLHDRPYVVLHRALWPNGIIVYAVFPEGKGRG